MTEVGTENISNDFEILKEVSNDFVTLQQKCSKKYEMTVWYYDITSTEKGSNDFDTLWEYTEKVSKGLVTKRQN